MCMNNRRKWKKLILAYSDTRKLYRVIRGLFLFLVISSFTIIFINYWYEEKLIKQKELLFGSWDEVIVDIDSRNISYFQNHVFIEKYAIQLMQERVMLSGQQIVIGYCNDDFFDLGNIKVKYGRLPEKQGEVAIEEEYLSVLNVSCVGDIISENVNVPSLSGYKVCGVIQNYSSNWKKVNWSVKYVNCFIKEPNITEINLFLKCSFAHSALFVKLPFEGSTITLTGDAE